MNINACMYYIWACLSLQVLVPYGQTLGDCAWRRVAESAVPACWVKEPLGGAGIASHWRSLRLLDLGLSLAIVLLHGGAAKSLLGAFLSVALWIACARSVDTPPGDSWGQPQGDRCWHAWPQVRSRRFCCHRLSISPSLPISWRLWAMTGFLYEAGWIILFHAACPLPPNTPPLKTAKIIPSSAPTSADCSGQLVMSV